MCYKCPYARFIITIIYTRLPLSGQALADSGFECVCVRVQPKFKRVLQTTWSCEGPALLRYMNGEWGDSGAGRGKECE